MYFRFLVVKATATIFTCKCLRTHITSSMASCHLLSTVPFLLVSNLFLHQTSTSNTIKIPLPPGFQMEFQSQLPDISEGTWFSSTPCSDGWIALHQFHHDSPRLQDHLCRVSYPIWVRPFSSGCQTNCGS